MSSKASERWERLAALGAKGEIPTPDGESKMSAVILQIAEPFLKQPDITAERAETIISLTVAGWNKVMFPPDKQSIIENELIDCFVPMDGSADALGLVVQVMDTVAERREKLFPDLRRIIVDYEVDISGGDLSLNASSATVPDLD